MQWPAVYSASPQRPGKEDIYHAVASSLFCFPSASVTVRRVFSMQWPAVYSASPQRPGKEDIYHAVTAVYSASPQRPGKEGIYHAVASSLFCFPSASR